ncbi:MAG: hypothetical protein ABIR32_10375 [Ilumatobacteraceae bacterium]
MNEMTPSQINTGKTHRARWAAIGAAVAVSLGAGGFGIANAVVTTSPKNVFVAITPCRLIDTRPPTDNVGPRMTPIDANETYTITGTGDVAGPCNIPTGISALELNVTAVGATAPTYLTFFPSDVARPTASNLNPAPGQPPTPNSVTVTLAAATGTFNVYNLTGKVDVIIDVVGYYDNHSHNAADITDEPGVSYNYTATDAVLTAATVTVVSTAIRVPADGFLTLEATIAWHPSIVGWNQAECEITVGTTVLNTTDENGFFGDDASASSNGFYRTHNLHKTVTVSAINNPLLFFSGQSVRLLCREVNGEVVIDTATITATYYPTEYEPSLILFPFADGNADEVGQVNPDAQHIDPTAPVDPAGPVSSGQESGG